MKNTDPALAAVTADRYADPAEVARQAIARIDAAFGPMAPFTPRAIAARKPLRRR